MIVNAELFFNAGDFDKQSNFLLYPNSLDYNDLDEVLQITCDKHSKLFRGIVSKIEQLEYEIEKNGEYPNPLKKKLYSSWYCALVKKGSLIYRFGYDGRKETGSGRHQYSIEGAFFKGIDLVKTVAAYQKKNIDILSIIGKELPENLEKILITEKYSLFAELASLYAYENKLDSLFNHFYVALNGKEFSFTKEISVPRLCKYEFPSIVDYNISKIKKELLYK